MRGAIGGLLLALVFGAIAVDGGGPVAGSALALAAGGIAALAARQRALRPAPREAILLVAAGAALAGLQLFWADARDAALDGAAALLAAGAAFLVGASALSPAERERWLAVFGLGGALVASVAIVTTLPGAQAAAPFGNPNRLAAWLLLPGAVAYAGMGICAPRGAGGWTILWFGVLALCGAALAASGSLGGGLAAAAAAGAVAWQARLPGRRGAALPWAALAGLALALAVLPLVAPDWVPWVREGGEFSPGIRWHVYGAAVHSALDAAPLGTGLGGFADAFARHRPGLLPYAPRHAHNELIQACVELGLPFLLLLACSLALVLWRARIVPSPRRSLCDWSARAAGIGVAAHALVDAPLHVPAVCFGLAVLLGFSWAARDANASARSTRLALAALAAALVLLGGSGLAAGLGEQRARAALEAGRFAQAERAARAGLWLRPQRAALWRRVAEAAEYQAELGDGGPQALARALDARERAARARPHSARLRGELAQARARVGDAQGSLAALAEASRLDPAAPGPHLARARLLLAQGRAQAAAVAAREALKRHPLATRPVVGALLDLTGDPELAIAAVPAQPFALARAGRELDRGGFARAAGATLERALLLDPANARVAVETARVWRRAGRIDRAASVLQQALHHAPRDVRLREELALTVAAARGGAS